MGVWGSKVLGVTVAALAAALVVATSAGAAERFAAPNGTGPAASCPELDPCSLTNAVHDATVADPDVVTLLPGSTNGAYSVPFLTIDDAITLRSRESDPVPVITTTTNISPGVLVSDGATLRRLRIESSQASTRALDITGANATVERTFVKGPATACRINATGVLISDSVCWTFNGGNALAMDATGTPTNTATVRNVTAVGESPGAGGILVRPVADQNLTLEAVNTIVSGETDVVAQSEGSNSVATVTLSNSNYDSEAENPVPAGGTATITNPGTGTNQAAPPAFLVPPNGPNGDFHQLPTSSGTIDRGTPTPSLLDLDSISRSVDGDCGGVAEPDIGAYELVVTCPGPLDPGTDTAPPDTAITDGPQGKTKKKTATISFGGTDARAVASFECKLDGGLFEPCTSPKTYSKLKKGKHTVEVRAIDAAGNVDPTPATRSWKVKKKKRKK